MKNFCKKVKKYATEIIDYAKKETLPLTKEEEKSCCKQKFVTCVKKTLVMMIKNAIKITVILIGNMEVLHIISVT